MIRLTLDLSGKDSVFLSNCYRYLSGLLVLALYRNPPERLPTLDLLKEKLDYTQQRYEGGAHGDRIQAQMRKAGRKEVTQMFKQILLYLQSVATEDDIPALLQVGFELHKASIRRKAVTTQTA